MASSATARPRRLPASLWWTLPSDPPRRIPVRRGGVGLTAPFAGWRRALLDAAAQSWDRGVDTAQLGQAAVPLIVVVGLAILVGAICGLRLRNVVHPAFLAMAALYACITPNGVQYPKDIFRELALVLTLLPFAIAARAIHDEPESARRYPRGSSAFSATTRKLKAKRRGQIRASCPDTVSAARNVPLSPTMSRIGGPKPFTSLTTKPPFVEQLVQRVDGEEPRVREVENPALPVVEVAEDQARTRVRRKAMFPVLASRFPPV